MSQKKQKARKPKTNYVRLGVTFPDGCWHTQQMDHECEEAHDAVKFGAFLYGRAGAIARYARLTGFDIFGVRGRDCENVFRPSEFVH